MTAYDPDQLYNVRRCGICAINWPDADDYQRCPACGDKTRRVGNASHTHESEEEARSARLHLEFERYWEERESARLAAERERARELEGIAEAGITEADMDALGGS